jgi:hypothetical protein
MYRSLFRLTTILVTALLAACAQRTPPPGVSFDPKTGLFAVHAKGVPRGELLDQLQHAAQVEVRPHPDPDTRLTLDADGLDVDTLLAQIMPPDAHYIARRGERELAARPGGEQRKEGPAAAIAAGLTEKGKGAKAALREGSEKRKDLELPARSAAEPGMKAKPAADQLVVKESNGPKQPLPTRVPRQSLRVTLLFEQGATPRVLAVQAIEGGPPSDTFVRGPFLFVLTDAGGAPVQFGSFEDPLEEHSYLESGEHSTGRAKSGITGISLAADKAAAATLQIIDARELTLPRELDAESMRGLVTRTKPIYTVRGAQLTRLVRQEKAQ